MANRSSFIFKIILLSVLFSTRSFAEKNDFSLALKFGLISAGVEADYDLGSTSLVAGCDLDTILLGGWAAAFVGLKEHVTESFFARLGFAYVFADGHGPGVDFVFGSLWRNGNVIYGADWIGGGFFYNRETKMPAFYPHFPKAAIGYIF